MKRVISVLCALVILSAGAFAQNPGQRRGGDNGWRERVRSEKVAFLTEEIDLTESEAQVFWPIYNQIQKEQRDNFEAVRKAYDAMAKGVQEGKSEKEMEKLVKAYIDAQADKSVFPAFTIEVGNQDTTVDNNASRELAEYMTEKGLTCEFIARDGIHYWDFWQQCLPKALKKVGESFK